MRLLIHILQTLIILFNKYNSATSICSSTYGAKPCPYVPSPPGERPPCAKNGYTYCEYPEHYPRDLVMHLIEKWKYDHATLLLNEMPHDYSNYFVASDTYGPPQNTVQSYPEPHSVYGPPATPTNQQNANSFPYPTRSPNSYIPPPSPIRQNQTYYHAHQLHQLHEINNFKNKFPYMNQNVYTNQQTQPTNHHLFNKNMQPDFNRFNQNVWSKWNGRKYYMRKKRSLVRRWLNNEHNSTSSLLLGDSPSSLDRKKRQSGSGETLCDSNSRFIMPRAAMNNKGDWMYVANVPEVDGRYSQLVRTETCASQRCKSLCGLPDGYTSRCEQRYVQKRLVAVEPGGGNLYTDVFWFPSCCLCTIARN